jgi:hypothetical protein
VRGEGRGEKRKRNSELRTNLNADERRSEQINADYEAASIKRK